MEPLVSSENQPESQHKRETWRGKFEFVLSLIGFSVGYGNVWLFPYLCYKNGGGCFLFPYVFFLALVAVPMMLLEVALGQLMQSGAITAWNIIPLFQGIGYAATIVGHWQNIYYAVILAWNLYYLFASFTSVLPWSDCDNSWNTDQCVVLRGSTAPENSTGMNASDGDLLEKLSASHEFWHRKVLQTSAGLEEPGIVKWDLALCLLLAWILCYLCVWRGTRSTKKIIYFTAVFPYVFMVAFMMRAVTLDGAREGLLYFINLDWPKLKTGGVWLDAAIQVLFSYSVGTGTLTALGSYNKFQSNMYRGCIIFALVNTFTSILSGVVIFALLGYLAKEEGVAVDVAAESGPALVFVAIPAAISRMPIAPLWSVLFFVMLLLVGIDSQFVAIQGFVTAVVDWYPNYLRKRFRKEIFTASICIFWFLIGLSMMTEGGLYVWKLLSSFSTSSVTLLIIAFFESIVVAWLYGSEDFYKYISGMNGFHIFRWIKFCWKFAIPLFCVGIIILNSVPNGRPTNQTYVYPNWSLAIGWLMSFCSVFFIPAVALFKLITTEGTLVERLEKLTTRNDPFSIQDRKTHKTRTGFGRKRLLTSEA